MSFIKFSKDEVSTHAGKNYEPRPWIGGGLRINISDIKFYQGADKKTVLACGDHDYIIYTILLSLEEVDNRITKSNLDPEMLSTALQYALVALDKLQERT